MNKCLYDRIQNLGQPISAVGGTPFIGASSQNLFDLEYVQQYTTPLGQIVQGNFFKVTIAPRANPLNVDEFLSDYFDSIDIFDQKNVYAQLINIITGTLFVAKNSGSSEISAYQKYLKILQRILGLCYDATPEIDVSGVAKISERDVVSDDFFELSNLDLRLIEEKVSDIQLNILQFQDCENIKVIMNTEAVIDALNEIVFVEGVNENNIINQTSNVINNVKNCKTFLIELMSQIGAVYTKIVYNIVRKDIKKLLKEVLADISFEKKLKIKRMIFPLTLLGIGASIKLLKDFRDCKSIVDELTKILSLVLKRKISALQANPNADVPLPLLFTARLLEGASPTRSYINTIQRMEELGIPTGPMPDGSPNEFLAAISAVIEGMDKENAENGKSVVAVGPLTVTPLFTTVPQKAYGKSF